MLDTAGGTDIFQMPTGLVKLTAGTDAVRCLHFSTKVFRWYTDCCRTPIGNTAGPRFPVVGLIHSFMSRDADGRSRDEVLGAPLLPNLRPLRRRAARAERACAALAQPLRPPRIKASRLVVAQARSVDPVLRRSYERSTLRAARTCAE